MSSLINWEVARGRAEELRGIELKPPEPQRTRRFRRNANATDAQTPAPASCSPASTR
jgi:hypothetical protein